MNYFLLLIIVALCGGGYYEYTQLEQAQQTASASDQQQIAKLQGDNKTLQAEKARLTKEEAGSEAQIADLTKQIQTAQTELALAKAAAAKAASSVPAPGTKAPAAPGAVAAASNNLGTITSLDGKVYQNCQLLKVDAEGITINHSEGITKIVYGLLPPDLQKRFGYDPHTAAALTRAQIQYQEEQRQAAAAAQSGGN